MPGADVAQPRPTVVAISRCVTVHAVGVTQTGRFAVAGPTAQAAMGARGRFFSAQGSSLTSLEPAGERSHAALRPS